MKQGIHPTYYTNATITCACGAVLETGSTVETMHTEICALCHPLYTGKKKVIDTTGRVDRFKKLSAKSQAKRLTSKKTLRVKEIEKEQAATAKTEVVA